MSLPSGVISSPNATERRIQSAAARLLGRWSPLIVSNRAPYEANDDGGFSRGSGGLATALLSLAEATNAPWLACARTPRERVLAGRKGAVTVALQGRPKVTVHYADPGRRIFSLYYSTVANPLLWFLQHYLWDLPREPMLDQHQHAAWTDGYVAVNRLMSEKVVELVALTQREPLVLTQDYHLYLLPRLVRRFRPEITMQHFVHIPWPTADYWKVLPEQMRNAIFDGLLANDVIGFQTERDVRRFLVGCEELLGLRTDYQERAVLHRGRVSWVRPYPISVDVSGLSHLAASPAVRREEDRIAAWKIEKLIVRVDRTDPAKNILRGFTAYGLLLQRHSELRGRVQFWAFLQPSRQDVPVYREYLREIKQSARRINSLFRTPGWLPIRLEIAENIERAVAAYKNYDVLLVNSLYDGMNLVAKEGSLLNRRQGVLVLSENVGAWEELGQDALTINPFDVEATTAALYQALTLPHEDRARRAARLRATVKANDIARWTERQFADLRELVGRPAHG
ncbi:MAG: trehalose-6-phosphate synthase [Candidatus Dormibacteraeota bacterium]|nr:trehalose-6-phosphate synthase [Candidatus Dormibacteraeota bacterium]